MNTKRKFVVGSVSEEDSDELRGFNLFKKYKSTAGPSGSTCGDSTTTNRIIKSNSTAGTVDLKEDDASAQPAFSSSSSMKKSEKPKIGRTFAETFTYLKDTDLYKLPPEKKEPPKPTVQRNTNAIIVNSRQRGNPILKHVRNVPYEFGEIIPDYEIGQTSCALFLSLRYHNLNPDYIHDRLKQLGSKYTLRVLLVQVDLVNTKHSLKELAKICLLAGMTLILAWSPEEAGRYLETYKSYEFKPPDVLQEKVEADHLSKMQDVLTTIKSVNKTDVITLMSTFGSFRNIVNAEKEELALCPGIGPQKAQRLYKVFNENFRRSASEILKRDNTETSPSKLITKTSSDETTVNTKDNFKTSILKPAELLRQLVPEAPTPDTQEEEVKKKSKSKTKEDVHVDKSPEKTFVIHPKKSPSSQSSRPALSKTAAITQSALSRTRKSKSNSTKTLIDTSPDCNEQSTSEKQKSKIPAPKDSSTILSSLGDNTSDSINESNLSRTRRSKTSSTKTLISRSPKCNETSASENQNIEMKTPKFSLATSGSSATKTTDLDIAQTKRLQKINSETASADVGDSSKHSPNINRAKLSTLVPMAQDVIPPGIRKKSQGTTEISQEDYDDLLASDEDSEDSS